jgi:hypothetical protein
LFFQVYVVVQVCSSISAKEIDSYYFKLVVN